MEKGGGTIPVFFHFVIYEFLEGDKLLIYKQFLDYTPTNHTSSSVVKGCLNIQGRVMISKLVDGVQSLPYD